MTPQGWQTKSALDFINHVSRKYVAERRQERQAKFAKGDQRPCENNEQWECYIDYLLDLEENGSLTLKDIQNEFTVFLIGGYETISIALTCTLFLLGTHPEHQEKIQEELNEVFGEGLDLNTFQVTANDLKRLRHLDLCMKESLRLFPPLPAFPKKTIEDVYLDDGKVIPANVDLFIWAKWTQRDPKYFPRPDDFIPERFLPENESYRQKGSYVYSPFSNLPRSCPGQNFALHSVKIALVYFLKAYEWEAVTSLTDLETTFQYISHTKNAVMKIKKRT